MSEIKFKPLGDRVLLTVLKETTSGLIVIPDGIDACDLPQRKGRVEAVSINDNELNSILKVGDHVMFQNMGVDVTLDGVDYKLVHLEYIQGILL